jgi:hypothetical protein
MTLDAAASALGHLMLGERGQKARRRRALLIRLGQRGPDLFGGGQPQLGKQQLDARGIARYRSDRPPSSGVSQPHDAEFVIQAQWRQFDSDIGNSGGIGGRAPGEVVEIGQSAAVELGIDDVGQLGFAGPFMGQRQQPDHGATCLLFSRGGNSASNARTGKNGHHRLAGLLRQSVFGRLAGYEDVNGSTRCTSAGRRR